MVTDSACAMSCGLGRESPRPYTSRRFVLFVSAYRSEALGNAFTYDPFALLNPRKLPASSNVGVIVSRFVPSNRTPAMNRSLLLKSIVFITYPADTFSTRSNCGLMSSGAFEKFALFAE